MNKTKAFLLHLAISACFAAGFLAILIWRWYPMPYFYADGGWQGIRLVVLIDIVLGPLLTLVVYKATKPRRQLLFDYLVIALIQVAALGYGTWTVFSQRTVMVVFADGIFYTVEAPHATQARAQRLIDETEEVPAVVLAQMPADPEACQVLRRDVLATGNPLFFRDGLLEPIDAHGLEQIAGYETRFSKFLNTPENEAERQRFLARTDRDGASLLFVPARCRYQDLVLVLDRSNGEVAGWLPLHASPEWGRAQG